MDRDKVVDFCRLAYSNKADMQSIIYFIWQYCVYRGKDPEQSKLFATTLVQLGPNPALHYAVEWCEKEFSINKLYSAPNPKGERELIQIF